jgi:WD40 repeat protein
VPAQATTKQQVNVRQGPGLQFPLAGKMPNNTSAMILGKSEDGKWFQVAFPDAAHPGWVSAAFVNVTGPVDQLPVVAVAPPPTPTPGAVVVATRAPAATPTQAVPPARGIVGFVSYERSSASYSLNNVAVDSHSISGFKLLGPQPFDLQQFTNAAPFAWAPNGSGQAAYVFGRFGDPKSSPNILRVTHRDGTDRQDLDSHQGISSPVWSPDGKTIAYIGMDNDYRTQFIYRINAGGGSPERFFAARGNESFRGLAYGKWLLFVSNFTGTHEIWRLNLDGSGAMQLTNDNRENGSPAWSPDGTKFAYYSKQVDGSYQIMVANFDGSNPRKLTNAGNNFTPTWSPDGNWIAFASTRGGGQMQVYIMDRNGGNVQVLTDKNPSESQMPGSWR